MMKHSFLIVVTLGVISPVLVDGAEITFNRDIRPILAANCFACHGFDARQRKADLRLDTADGAYADRDGTIAIKPKDLSNSEVWRRLTANDPDIVMPPPATKKKLTQHEKDTIRQWIEQGAEYQKHWAFEAPVQARVPEPRNPFWAKNDLDRFLLARLESEGLAPSPEADRSTLIRRVSFALTGLPPTLAELDAFESDSSPQAYEKMVDRYLKSPRYGEEMARHWLDVARYADTHGLHLDNERTMWAYRDWVVQAFNDNKRFDTFTIEQLAGDLLPNPTPQQLTATGFNRCNVTTSEGGSIAAEFVYRYAVDRTSTMIQTWMGLTGGCAVCHDHKYDPLTMREFYSLYAFFNSAADPAMDKNINTTDPFFKIATDEQTAELSRLRAAAASAKQRLEQAARQAEYVDAAEHADHNRRLAVEDVWLDDLFPGQSKVTCSSRNESVWSDPRKIEPKSGRRALQQFSAANYHDKFDDPLQPLIVPEQPRLSVWVRLDPFEPSQTLKLELVTNRGNRRFLWGDATKYGADNFDKDRLGDLPPPGQWTRLEIPADKLQLQTGDSVRGVTLAQFGGIAWWDALTMSGEVDVASDPRSSMLVWWKSRAGKDTPGVPKEIATLLKQGPTEAAKPREANADDNKRAEQVAALRQFFLAFIARPINDELRERQREWLDAQAAVATFEDSIPGTMIFKDLDKPRESFVMLRGQYDKPGEKVEPNVPAIFPPLVKQAVRSGDEPPAADRRPNRLDLANWLVSAEHPLTARVTVNRFWQQFFGTGLVKTSYDFGTQGDLPSHPELLDWLAIWYRENGWDTKALVRLIVTSAAFRQSAQVTPELLRRDPDNRLLARGPRFRLDAEQVRDNALFVSGLINLEMGGRGVKSYQPPNIWEPVGYSDSNTRYYLQDHGDALYRRSIYAFLKRTAPPPFMSNFDAPNREQFCTKRERSNTPLQALQLLNDTQHFEAARAFGERLLTEGGESFDERLAFAYRVALSREPATAELATLRRAFEYYSQRYRDDVDAARKVVSVGESKPKSAHDVSELATYTLLANLILNLDETITRN
jgi:hypothetical protein